MSAFHKMRNICLLAEELLASQEGISSTGLKKKCVSCLLPATCAPPGVQYEGAKNRVTFHPSARSWYRLVRCGITLSAFVADLQNAKCRICTCKNNKIFVCDRRGIVATGS